MTETNKLLVRIGTARDAISRKTELTSLDYMIDGVLMNCSVLLKEQKDKLDHIVEFKKGDVVQTFSCNFCHTQYRAVLKGHETIHCKECEHYTPHGSSGICGSWGEWCDPDEWCSRAVLLTEVRRYDNQ